MDWTTPPPPRASVPRHLIGHEPQRSRETLKSPAPAPSALALDGQWAQRCFALERDDFGRPKWEVVRRTGRLHEAANLGQQTVWRSLRCELTCTKRSIANHSNALMHAHMHTLTPEAGGRAVGNGQAAGARLTADAEGLGRRKPSTCSGAVRTALTEGCLYSTSRCSFVSALF